MVYRAPCAKLSETKERKMRGRQAHESYQVSRNSVEVFLQGKEYLRHAKTKALDRWGFPYAHLNDRTSE